MSIKYSVSKRDLFSSLPGAGVRPKANKSVLCMVRYGRFGTVNVEITSLGRAVVAEQCARSAGLSSQNEVIADEGYSS